MSQTKANLDPWHILRTVIDAGGFAQAAQQLQRSQSALSYAVSKLQDQLGLDLLTIKGRRAVLTDHGALLLNRMRALLDDYEDLLELADSLRLGHEPGLSLWIDAHCPSQFLHQVLGEFQTHFPKTVLNICQSACDGQTDGEGAGQADLVISSQQFWAMSSQNLGELEWIAVAQPNHPLMGCDPPITPLMLKKHRCIAIQGRVRGLSEQKQPLWTVSSHQQAVEAVLLGQAFGWLQKHLIIEHLARETLKPLALESGERYKSPVYLQYNPQRQHGPAAKALGALIQRQFSLNP
jgi:DNA-binding transcriptional LysR family regulator